METAEEPFMMHLTLLKLLQEMRPDVEWHDLIEDVGAMHPKDVALRTRMSAIRPHSVSAEQPVAKT